MLLSSGVKRCFAPRVIITVTIIIITDESKADGRTNERKSAIFYHWDDDAEASAVI